MLCLLLILIENDLLYLTHCPVPMSVLVEEVGCLSECYSTVACDEVILDVPQKPEQSQTFSRNHSYIQFS